MATLPPQAPTEIGFYPTQDYLVPTETNKGTPWGAMKMPLASAQALAKSQAYAEHSGLIDPETAKYYLASALTEGRFDDYGVNQVAINNRTAPQAEWQTIANAKDKAVLQAYRSHTLSEDEYKAYKKFGDLNPSKIPGMDKLNELFYGEQFWPSTKVPDRTHNLRQKAFQLGFDKFNTEVLPNQGMPGYGKYDVYHPKLSYNDTDTISPEDLAYNAALKTLALVNVIDEKGKTGLDAWQGYNGSGSDARRYKQRVSDAYDNLSHEKNKDMWNAYQNMVKQYKLELKHGKN